MTPRLGWRHSIDCSRGIRPLLRHDQPEQMAHRLSLVLPPGADAPLPPSRPSVTVGLPVPTSSRLSWALALFSPGDR